MITASTYGAQTYVYDVGTLSWVAMTQPLVNAGSVTISGAVSQGTGGSSAWLMTRAAASGATPANVSASASNVTLLSANTSRRGAAIFNDSTSAMYVKFGATASTSSFTVKIGAGGYYEFPEPAYAGIVDAIWDAAAGAARVTELT